MPNPPHRGFMITIPESHLTIEEVWPDGDAPENPTVEDVIEVMKQSGHVGQVISEWNLAREIEVFDNQTAKRAVFQ